MNEDDILAELEGVGAEIADADTVDAELEKVGAKEAPGVLDRTVSAIADSPVTKSFAKGLGSREAEREPSIFNTGNRYVDQIGRHTGAGQFLNYAEKVSRDPGSILRDLGALVEGGVDLQTGKAARELGMAVRSGKGGEVLQALAESLGRDVAHGGLDPQRPVQSPVNVLGIGSVGAGALQKMPGFQPPDVPTSAPAGPVARAAHKRGRYLSAADEAERLRNYSRGAKVQANEILTRADDLDTRILKSLETHPKRAEISAARREMGAIKDALAQKVLGLADDAESPAGGGSIDDLAAALEAKQAEIDALMQLRRSDSGASALASQKGGIKTYEWKPAVNEAKSAARDAFRASTDRMVRRTAMNRDPFASITVPEVGGNSAFLQTGINKLKDILMGGSAEGAFAREQALRNLKPGPGLGAAAGASASDEALRKLYEALSPWDLAD